MGEDFGLHGIGEIYIWQTVIRLQWRPVTFQTALTSEKNSSYAPGLHKIRQSLLVCRCCFASVFRMNMSDSHSKGRF